LQEFKRLMTLLLGNIKVEQLEQPHTSVMDR
jgi:hypothetical protein